MSEVQLNRKNNTSSTKILIFSLAASMLFVLTILLLVVLVIKDEEISRRIIIISVALLLLMIASLLFLLKIFFNGVKLVNHNAYLLSRGELNISDILVNKTKGLELLSIAFNDMKSNLLSFTELTKGNVIVISDAIDKVSSSLDMSYQGNEQIAASMSKVAMKAQEQLVIVKATLDKIEDVSRRTGNITTSLANIELFVETTVKSTNEGSEHLDDYHKQMNVISDNLTNTSHVIEQLNEELEEINQVSGFIIKISDQLKMLALNASVEAARAGDVGKGFSVVADEMNKLSTATRQNIAKINSVLVNVVSSSSNVSESIDGCIENYNISKDLFNAIKDSFYVINNNANILSQDMKKVYHDARRINVSTEEINKKGQELYNASNEISSKTQEVAAVTQEELAEVEVINSNTVSLKDMVTGIENLLRRFKTSIEPVNAMPSKKLNIVFVSPLDHEFWVGVRQGVLYAQKELLKKNVNIEYVGFLQNTNDIIVATFKEWVEKGCDGIVVPGFSEELVPLIDRASQKGIPVMLFNCETPIPSKRTAYFGPNVNAAGDLAGKLMIKALNGKGNVAIFRGGLNVSIHKTRRDLIVQSLKSKRNVKVVSEIEAADNSDVVYTAVKQLLSKNQNIDGIFITGGGVIGAAKAIEELRLIGKTRIICFDYNQEIFELIRKDIVYSAIGQDPFGQGHDPIISLYNYLVTKVKPESDVIWTRLEVVDKTNVDDLV